MYGGEIVGPASEDDWQAEDDARTIVRAEAIKADPKRMEKARAAAKKIADRERIEKETMESLAKGFDYGEQKEK